MKKDFIVFEWIDWSWKDTQMMLFIEKLKKFNKYEQILITRDPSNTTKSWNQIAQSLLNGWFKSPNETLELYVSDRIERSSIYENIIKYATIVASRYDLSTYAYQWIQWFSYDEVFDFHQKKAIDLEWFLFEPNITFLFDISPELVMERISLRWEKKEAFETLEQLSKARDKYLDAIKYLSEKTWRKTIIIDASKSIEEVSNSVWDEFLKIKLK